MDERDRGQGSVEFAIVATADPNAAANVNDYWFSYDRENRVVVANGKLVNVSGVNQILWAAGQDSAVHSYDAGGRRVMKAYEDADGGLKIGDRT